ncbi:hypothetical protein UFOVP89_10 [uncultured Caudovirales phage]|uniref:Uncharacterized protein n=1 Tax=uncultured Caudovirales phage TaxID=2100421 RepID=A0A6J5L2V1_9CAUD|nr:hypothetical protein UFOVP89_10 [uncultured Caudovirales phage]
MAEYDNTNTFALFKNDKGDNPKRPDYTGTANVDGIEFRISGWIREGAKGKFISGSVQLKDNNSAGATRGAAEDVDEDVPF